MAFKLSLSKDVKSPDKLLEFISFDDIFAKKLRINIVLIVKLCDLVLFINL